jgi:hypothetical protein
MFQFADNMRPEYFLSSEYLKTLDKEKLDQLVLLSKILNTLDSKEDQKTILKLLMGTIYSLLELVEQDKEDRRQKMLSDDTYKEMTDLEALQKMNFFVRQQNIAKEAESQLNKIRQYAQAGLDGLDDKQLCDDPFEEDCQIHSIGLYMYHVKTCFEENKWKTDQDTAVDFQARVTFLERLIAEYRFYKFIKEK